MFRTLCCLSTILAAAGALAAEFEPLPAMPQSAPPAMTPSPAAPTEPLHGTSAFFDDDETAWDWHFLPNSIIYHSYLAGAKEPRFASLWANEKNENWIWDITLGGRVGLLRYGTPDELVPQGWQLDMEGAASPRLDLEHNEDLVASDFRFGAPLTYGSGAYQAKLAVYHLSSHVGDEYLLRNPSFTRINYSRNAIVWGNSVYCRDDTRLYAEAGWAYDRDVSKPWEFQFGVDYSPLRPGRAPFAAINAHLREEVSYGGNFVIQAGWQWRPATRWRLFRAGFEYYNGKSDQFEFYSRSEQKVGLGLWYDY